MQALTCCLVFLGHSHWELGQLRVNNLSMFLTKLSASSYIKEITV